MEELRDKLEKQFGKLDRQEEQIMNYFKDYEKSCEYIRKYRADIGRYESIEHYAYKEIKKNRYLPNKEKETFTMIGMKDGNDE